MTYSGISNKILNLAREAEEEAAERFAEIDAAAAENTARVMEIYRNLKVSDSCFAGTTGYGYDDLGREILDKAYAGLFGAEAALVRLGFVNGTHAIATALFACLRPGDTLLSVMGAPYDTLRTAIGISGSAFGSLTGYGVRYAQVDWLPDGSPDLKGISEAAGRIKPACVLLQRSRGYAERKALTLKDIKEICAAVKEASPDTAVVVDNCYGEFVETREPTSVGADLCAGSLIKNPGGGIAPSGGYVAGRADLVRNASYRLTCPGIGGECGATLAQNRLLFQGLFMAPHTVGQALRTSVFCAALLGKLGYETSPAVNEPRADIIQRVTLGSADALVRFCKGIQAGSPVDAYLSPEPWAMPGYDCEVVMAAGTFVQGASIELSADGPLREPYYVFVQGGLTYESGKLGIMAAASSMDK